MNDRLTTHEDAGEGPQVEGHASASTAGSIDLNVKTLDHRVYRVNLLASSSVPQLKRKIEDETGVVSDRQRLIFRGKVLKNERDLAFYALEDGHTLHLVIRPLDADQASATPEQAPQRAPTPSPTASSTSSTNDEPDPSLLNPSANTGGLPMNRVLMGATITLPEGQRGMPFLQSILSNIMSTVQGLQDENGEVPQQEPAHAPQEAPRARGRPASASTLERVVRRASSNRSRASRLESTLRTISQYLDNAETAFPTSVTDATNMPALNDADFETLRDQLASYVALLQRFQPQLAHIPTTLQQLHALREDRAAQGPLVVPFVRAIETLQAFGDLCKLLALMSRRLFLRFHSTDAFNPTSADQPSAPEAPAPPNENAPTDETRAQRMSQLYSIMMNQLGGGSAATGDANGSNNGPSIVQAQIPLPAGLLQQLRESLPEGADHDHFEFEATIPIWQVIPMLQPTPTAAPQEAAAAPPAAVAAPPTSPQWDFEGFAQFLMVEVPAYELYGLLSGQRASLQAILRRIGARMLEGPEMPPMAPGSNREWSTRFINALRDAVGRGPRFPSPVFRTNVLSELVERVSPFIPELIHLCIRATTVTTSHTHASAVAFMDTVVDFLGHMARQFVTDLRSLLVDATTPTATALERVLNHCGVHGPFAAFAVDAFLNWPAVGASRRRPAETPSAPDAKRPRRA
ncbi:hypothetical protein SDRG_06395 [Saprolegnia diclina VS20]|uniref:Ubiquitin-like domain-containing protein n=1 Tax=Saprolegnia diclina (strain VS20) TaxID=1156394 RepID=T0QQV0_SAPDV|nr:hypothetical protein SDRG_06395 [Saprolegnia diclina VS20]EQC36290.1 hypothetical protein SDRG_06395 [Saprolegnia diclina VS20]|eukprot:XP_008610396.1 hypothetical protein SDRG_06395 [Saprolegnia diclina VS20]